MAERSLELTIISAQGLNNVNLVRRMSVYAVVYINGAGKQDQKQKSRVDKDGDSNPTWNQRMNFKIDESAALHNRLTLVVKIKAEGMFCDKDVGEVHVPIKELLEGDNFRGKPLQFVSYQVRKPSGQPKGELSFSYKFDEKHAGFGTVEEPVMAYPAGKPNNSGEFVTAYPAVGYESNSVYPPLYATPVGAYLGTYPPAPTVTSEGGRLEIYPSAPTDTALNSYPPAGGAYYPPPAGYPATYAGYPYQQQSTYDGYPTPPALGYGGYPPQSGYGCPPVQRPQKTNNLGLGLGAGLLGGALGGLLIGDIVSEAADGGGCGGGCGGGYGGF